MFVYPSRGGFIAYLVEAFGNGKPVGITSWLLYFVLLIVTAMVAVAFGAYGSALFFGDDAPGYWTKILASAVVVGMAVINLFGAKMVAKAQSIVVWVLLVVFVGFAVVTLFAVKSRAARAVRLPPVEHDRRECRADVLRLPRLLGHHLHGRQPPRSSSDAAASDVPGAGRSLTVLYVAVSLGVFGTLTVDEVIAARRHGTGRGRPPRAR